MPRQNKNRKGGFTKVYKANRQRLDNGDLMSREAPTGLFRVISIKDQEVWIEGTFSIFLDAKKIADDKAVDGVECYIHGSGPRVIYRAR